jgi:hypothetical protein
MFPDLCTRIYRKYDDEPSYQYIGQGGDENHHPNIITTEGRPQTIRAIFNGIIESIHITGLNSIELTFVFNRTELSLDFNFSSSQNGSLADVPNWFGTTIFYEDEILAAGFISYTVPIYVASANWSDMISVSLNSGTLVGELSLNQHHVGYTYASNHFVYVNGVILEEIGSIPSRSESNFNFLYSQCVYPPYTFKDWTQLNSWIGSGPEDDSIVPQTPQSASGYNGRMMPLGEGGKVYISFGGAGFEYFVTLYPGLEPPYERPLDIVVENTVSLSNLHISSVPYNMS